MSAFQLGLDRSGNANHFNAINVVETDRVIDTPTNNFSVMNNLGPLTLYDRDGGSLTYPAGNPTFAEGNLQTVTPNNGSGNSVSTIGVESGKWYAEVCLVAITSLQRTAIAITGDASETIMASTNIGSLASGLDVCYFFNGTKFTGNSETANAGASYAVGDVMGIALNVDDSEVTFYKNNSSQFTQSFTAGGTYHFAHGDGSAGGGSTNVLNFGQDSSFAGRKTPGNKQDANSIGDFFYAPPAGFLALCTKNLPEPTIVDPSEHFDVVLYTGNGGSKTISGYNFQPDFVWGKARNQAYNGHIHDAVRGVEKRFATQNDDDETADGALKTFTSDGYTFDTAGAINVNNTTYVNWSWKANGSGASNTDGSITTTVSANVDAGFSIIKYTGTNSSTPTIGHGLSKAPEFWVTKPRTDVSDNQWFCCHKDFASDFYTDFNHWDNNSPVQDSGARWGDTAPSTSVITIGNTSTNKSGDYICYAWHSVEGYSKIGTYDGTGNVNGQFIHTGFRPKFVWCKDLNNSNGWQLFDSVRSPSNPMNERLLIDLNNAEQTNVTAYDFLSNGFKIRTSDSSFNSDNTKYIYYAVAEAPFKFANAR